MRPTASVAGLGLATLLVAALAAVSLSWRFDYDTPLFLYAGQLMADGEVPYRDFFDFNAPLTLWLNQLIVSVVGISDVGVRVADLAYLSLLLVVTWSWARLLGRRVAVASILLFSLVYLGGGPLFSLQRDYLLLLPWSAAIAAAAWPTTRRPPLGVRAFASGALVAAALLIKPHAAIALPAFAVFFWQEARPASGEPSRRLRTLAALVAGTGMPLAMAAGVLARQGALAPLLEIAREYWPLYAALSGEFEILAPARALEYRFFGSLDVLARSPLLVPSIAGLVLGYLDSTREAAQKRLLHLVVLLQASAIVYAAVSGKLWSYHWLPYAFFSCVLASLLVAPPPQATGDERPPTRALATLVFAIALLQVATPALPKVYFALHGAPRNAPQDGRVDQLVDILEDRLEPGDTVQALDITAGSLNAMVRVQAPHGTRFLMAKYFFHSMDDPFVEELRRRFLADLAARPPRIIIEIERIWSWLRGPGVDRRFRALRRILETEYRPVERGPGFIIHEHRLPRRAANALTDSR